MAFAVERLAEWAGQAAGALLEGLPSKAEVGLRPYCERLQGSRVAPQPGSPLLSIFSLVQPASGVEPPQRYWRAGELALEPVASLAEGEARQADRRALWEGFAREAAQVLKKPTGSDDLCFDTFTHLLHRWAWAVPCSYGEPGVSLYDEFRTL